MAFLRWGGLCLVGWSVMGLAGHALLWAGLFSGGSGSLGVGWTVPGWVGHLIVRAELFRWFRHSWGGQNCIGVGCIITGVGCTLFKCFGFKKKFYKV